LGLSEFVVDDDDDNDDDDSVCSCLIPEEATFGD
jgi:hypothetical protein